MNHCKDLLTGPFAMALLLAAAVPAEAESLLWIQGHNGTSLTSVPSAVHSGLFSADQEAADDFDLTGTIERVLVGATNTFGCDPDLQGVWVRFYEDLGGTPGVLQYEAFIPAGDPGLVIGDPCPFGFDVRLPAPFQATGRHFLGVQVATAQVTSWSWSSTSTQPFYGSWVRWRNKLAGSSWGPYQSGPNTTNRDMWFELWGEGPPPPPVTELLISKSKQFLGDEIDSNTWPTPSKDVEAADDFDLVAAVERIVVPGQNCFQCPYPNPDGAWVRFYEWTTQGPGVLQYEEFVPVTGDPLAYYATLPTPFMANGKHFISFQLSAPDPHGWGWSVADLSQPLDGSPLWIRDNLSSPAWSLDSNWSNADLAIQIFGKDLSGQVQIFPDPCGDWTEEPVPPPSPNSVWSILRGIAVAGPQDVWAGGEYSFKINSAVFPSRALLYHWDGTSWTPETLPVPLPVNFADAALWDVEAIASDDVWAAGLATKQDAAGFLNPQVLLAHFDGSDWSIVPTPVPGAGLGGSAVWGIDAIATDDVWFVGEWGGNAMPAMAMHWDGSGLELFVLPLPGYPCDNGGYGLAAVSAASSDDVWAVGGGHDLDFGICSYIVHWDGTSWSPVPVPEPGILNRLEDVEAISSDDVWAVGQYFDGVDYKAYALHWDGSSWQLYDDLPTGALALHAFGPDDVYAAGGGIARWDGNSWRQVSDLGSGSGLVTGPSVADLDAIAPCSLWAAGRQLEIGIQPFVARHTPSQYAGYCTAKLNSLGCTPTMVATGVPSVSGVASSIISAVQVVNNKPGLFFYGHSGAASSPFLGGVLCVQPPLKRTSVTSSFGSPPPDNCSGVLSFDFNNWAQSGSDPLLASGSNLHGQWWSRDPAQADGTGVSLTDAISFTVQ